MLHLFGVTFDVLVDATLYLVTANELDMERKTRQVVTCSSCHFVKLTVGVLACILDPVDEYERKEKNLLVHQYDNNTHFSHGPSTDLCSRDQ